MNESNTHQFHTLGDQPVQGGYLTYVMAAFGQGLLLLIRRPRLLLVSGISLLPVLIPIMIAFFSRDHYASDGTDIFIQLATRLHISVFVPLLSLFFGSMLIAEEIESQTITYLLTRPSPRSAWVLGRFMAYALVATSLLWISLTLTYIACTTLADLDFAAIHLKLLAWYAGIGVLGILTYGTLSMYLGAGTKRPIVYGVLLFFGWEPMARVIPGIVDFLTVMKYLEALFPPAAPRLADMAVQSTLGEYTKLVYSVQATHALMVLAALFCFFMTMTVWALRSKEFAGTRMAR